MALTTVTLLNAVSAVGFGSIVTIGETPIKFGALCLLPSEDAEIDFSETVGMGVQVQYSFDANFPQPAEGHEANWATGLVAVIPLVVNNPSQHPAPQTVVNLWLPEIQNVQRGMMVCYPYMRAKLLCPISTGTVTVKFYYE